MTSVFLEHDGKKWNEVAKSDFWIDKPLYEKLKNLKEIQGKEWDGVIIVDGKERSGKSILGMVCGWFLSDGKLTENNFCTGLKDASRKIAEIPDGSVVVLDEGSLMFSSKDSSNKAQKQLMKILDVVGQKNLIFIICLPCFFDLNKTIAVRRSLFLMHVYPDDKYNRGNYAFWGEKKKGTLYRIGKKHFDSYEYPPAEFVGRYLNFKPPFYDKYISEIKKASLKEVLDIATEGQENALVRYWKDVGIVGRLSKKYPQLSQAEIGKIMDSPQRTISDQLQAYKRQEAKDKNVDNDGVISVLVLDESRISNTSIQPVVDDDG